MLFAPPIRRVLNDATDHRQVKYLNNPVEADHGKLKRLIKPTLGFTSMKAAYATLKGSETIGMFREGQFLSGHKEKVS